MSRTIDRVLIAERGVTALAIAKRIEAGGRETVLLMAEQDGGRAWIEEVPYVVYVPNRATDGRWPDDARVVHAAQDAGCDAVHPAGGWLSQDADFAERFSRLNTALLSPGPEVLGRIFAPGALAGVAGASVMAPVAAEQIRRARWIEVPVLGDGVESAMALGDRELHQADNPWNCLVEAPAPDLSPSLRENLHEQAEIVASKLSVPGPATARFAVLPGGGVRLVEFVPGIQPWFAVTDQVYGLDIVDAQLRMAEGEGLGWSRDSIAPQGAALWMMISALGPDPDAPVEEPEGEDESPTDPPSGVVVVEVHLPEHGEVVSAVTSGDRVSPGDSLASVLVSAPTRQAALVLAKAAMDQVVVGGLLTTAEGITRQLVDPEFWRAPGLVGPSASGRGH